MEHYKGETEEKTTRENRDSVLECFMLDWGLNHVLHTQNIDGGTWVMGTLEKGYFATKRENTHIDMREQILL